MCCNLQLQCLYYLFSLLSMLVYEQYFLTCVLMSHISLEILLRMIWLRCIRGKNKGWNFCWHLLLVEFVWHLIYGYLIRSYRRGCWTFSICHHHIMVYLCLKMSINCYRSMWDIENMIFWVTLDNASTNDVFDDMLRT